MMTNNNQKAIAILIAFVAGLVFLTASNKAAETPRANNMVTIENKSSRVMYVAFFKDSSLRKIDGAIHTVESNSNLVLPNSAKKSTSRIVAVAADHADLTKGKDSKAFKVTIKSQNSVVLINTPCCGPTQQPVVTVR